ncbi:MULTISPECIES: lasso RiPP family leader peptide-containing protein [unclassified Nonomuraea]
MDQYEIQQAPYEPPTMEEAGAFAKVTRGEGFYGWDSRGRGFWG